MTAGQSRVHRIELGYIQFVVCLMVSILVFPLFVALFTVVGFRFSARHLLIMSGPVRNCRMSLTCCTIRH